MNKLKSIGYLQGLLYGWVFVFLFFFQNAYASEDVVIKQLALDSSFGRYIKTDNPVVTPFFLDTKGHVWAYEMPLISQKPLQLPDLKDIVHLAPFIAVDNKGDVYTWGFKIKLLVPETDDSAGDNEVAMSYSPAKKVEGLKDIVYVAHYASHFAAIDKVGKIYHWYALNEGEQSIVNGKVDYPKDYVKWRHIVRWDGINAMDYSTMRVIDSDKEAVKVAINYRGILALNKDGSVYGWGISNSGQEIVSNEPLGNEVTFHVNAALHVTDIALNPFHIAFISDGKAHFYGGCDLGGRDVGNGKPWTFGVITDYVIPLDNLKSLYLPNNDNEQPDAFIDINGNTWVAALPQPSGVTSKERDLCDSWAWEHKQLSKGLYETLGEEPPRKIFEGKQVKQSNLRYALDQNGSVLFIHYEFDNSNFTYKSILQKADFNHNVIK